MKMIVVVPTYNERDTIGLVIEILEAEFRLIPQHELAIVVVDGHSPDHTAEVVREKMSCYQNIHLLVEKEKLGLGGAYITGINYAIRELEAEAVIEFDGDGQHDPRDVKRLIAEFDRGFDYVIGSRYVSGGTVPAEWSCYRKWLSRGGNVFIKWALRLPIHDNTSGLRLSRVQNFAEKLPLDEKKILSKRHAYKIHLLYEMVRMGARVKEIPITFRNRESGSSKSTFEDIVEFLKVVLGLSLRKLIKKRS